MDTSSVVRWIKAALVGFVGAYATLVTFGNLTDPMTNYVFVEHVLRMDTTFQGEALMWRSMETGWLHQVAFGLIVLTEAAVAFFSVWGAFRLFLARHATAALFHAAKAPALVGLFLCLALFFFGFQVVGGEWFASWQSVEWNGLSSASRTVTFVLGTLIFVSLQNDGEGTVDSTG